MKDYKDTLLMMKTDFPMRGNLGVNEHNIQRSDRARLDRP